jgi:hypothetical protein
MATRDPLVGVQGWPRDPVYLTVGGVEMESGFDLDRKLANGNIVQSFHPVDMSHVNFGHSPGYGRVVGPDGRPIGSPTSSIRFLITPAGDRLVTPAGVRLMVP